MRHRVFGRKLGRDTKSRKSLLRNLTNDLFLYGRVKTTAAKAKFVQSYAEKAITIAKKSKLGAKRPLASSLTSKALLRLINEIAPGFENRAGGYTRIIKLSPRIGDNSAMAKIELLEWDKSKAKTKTLSSLPKQAIKKAAQAKKKNKIKKTPTVIKRSNKK